MARYKPGRVDANHKAIKDGLRALGFSVLDLSSCGNGTPDLLVAWGGQQLLVEVKAERGKLTEMEADFFKVWPIGLAVVARNVEDVLREFGRI